MEAKPGERIFYSDHFHKIHQNVAVVISIDRKKGEYIARTPKDIFGVFRFRIYSDDIVLLKRQ